MATSEATVADLKPLGKEEVVAAVLAAASELFAEKGPAATSIREVAARAGVNHGLLHRHFGSKRQLLAATLQYLADSGAKLRESGAPAEELEAAQELQARVMVRSTLDGFPIEELQKRFPGMERVLEAGALRRQRRPTGTVVGRPRDGASIRVGADGPDLAGRVWPQQPQRCRNP